MAEMKRRRPLYTQLVNEIENLQKWGATALVTINEQRATIERQRADNAALYNAALIAQADVAKLTRRLKRKK